MECELENITIYYEMYGEGRPILLLHGGYIDHRHMVKEMEPLFEQRNGWKRIYPDLPGHGRTPPQDWITSHDKVLEIIFDFVGKVIPGQCFAIAGVSRGGYLGRGIIYKKPELVDGVLFLVPALYAVASEDSMVGYRDAWKMLESYPRATFAILEKAGHFLGLEQEELFLALANEWLQRVEEFVGSMTN